jgi:hypothetical protein
VTQHDGVRERQPEADPFRSREGYIRKDPVPLRDRHVVQELGTDFLRSHGGIRLRLGPEPWPEPWLEIP